VAESSWHCNQSQAMACSYEHPCLQATRPRLAQAAFVRSSGHTLSIGWRPVSLVDVRGTPQQQQTQQQQQYDPQLLAVSMSMAVSTTRQQHAAAAQWWW